MAILPLTSSNRPAAPPLPNQTHDRFAPVVEEIFQKFADRVALPNAMRNNGPINLFRAHLTEKLRASIDQPNFDVEAFKRAECDKLDDVFESNLLRNRIDEKLDQVKEKYKEYPQYVRIFRVLDSLENDIRNLVKKHSDGKKVSVRRIKLFKADFLALLKTEFKVPYPQFIIDNLNCIDRTLNRSVRAFNEEMDEFLEELRESIEMYTLKSLVQIDRDNRVHHSGGACFGDSLAVLSPYQDGMNASGAFFQVHYEKEQVFSHYYDPIRIITGKKIMEQPASAFPLLRADACRVLNCHESELQMLDPLTVNTVVGRLAAAAIKKEVRDKYDSYEFDNICTIYWRTLSNVEIEQEQDFKNKLGHWILQHPQDFPNTLAQSNSNRCDYVGRDAVHLLLDNTKKSNELLKLRILFNSIRTDTKKAPILDKIGLDQTAFIETAEDISTLPACIRKCSSQQLKCILKVNRENTTGHAMALSFGQKYGFFDPNLFDPVDLRAKMIEFDNVEDLINFVVRHLASAYRSNAYTNFSLVTATHVQGRKYKVVLMRRWMALDSSLTKKMTEASARVDAMSQRLMKNKSMTPHEKDRLEAEIEKGRMALEEDCINLNNFHEQLKGLLIEQLDDYQAKLNHLIASKANPKTIMSYRTLIDSYFAYIQQLYFKPHASVGSKRTRA